MASTLLQVKEPMVVYGMENTTPVSISLPTAGTRVLVTDQVALQSPDDNGFEIGDSDEIRCGLYGPVEVEVDATIATTLAAGAIQSMQLLVNGSVVDEDHRVSSVAANTTKLMCRYVFNGAAPSGDFDGSRIDVAFVSDTNADTAEVYRLQVRCRRFPLVHGTAA